MPKSPELEAAALADEDVHRREVAVEHLAAVQLAEHLEDARDLAPRRALGPALAGAVQERAEVAVARVLEGEAVEDAAVGAHEGKRVEDADRPRMAVEQLAEVRLAQPAVDALADLDADGRRGRRTSARAAGRDRPGRTRPRRAAARCGTGGRSPGWRRPGRAPAGASGWLGKPAPTACGSPRRRPVPTRSPGPASLRGPSCDDSKIGSGGSRGSRSARAWRRPAAGVAFARQLARQRRGPRRPAHPPSSDPSGGRHVLVHAEQVRRVVLRLDPGEALVVRAVGSGAHALGFVGGHEVHVDPSRRETRRRLIERPCPADARAVLRGAIPPRVHVDHEVDVPVRIGRGLGGDAIDGAAEAGDEDLALRGRQAPYGVEQGVDQAVAEFDEVV